MSANFVKYDLGHVSGGTVVEITLANRANVHLVDAHNFSRYQRGETFTGIGGQAVKSPIRLQVPSSGHWHVVLDLGGATGTIRSSMRVLSTA